MTGTVEQLRVSEEAGVAQYRVPEEAELALGPDKIFGLSDLSDGFVIKGDQGKYIEGLISVLAASAIGEIGPQAGRSRIKDILNSVIAGGASFLNFRALLASETSDLFKVLSAVFGTIAGLVAVGSIILVIDPATSRSIRSKKVTDILKSALPI